MPVRSWQLFDRVLGHEGFLRLCHRRPSDVLFLLCLLRCLPELYRDDLQSGRAGHEDRFSVPEDHLFHHGCVYLQMAADIWDPDAIKDIAGGWEEETEKEFFKSEKALEFTVEYYDKSWPDALKYGFLSANVGGSGRYLRNIQEGDVVYCHIAGSGFVGIGICTATAVPMSEFMVNMNGVSVPIKDVQWIKPAYKSALKEDQEIFIRVDWKNYVEDQSDGYWEKGMTSVPLVAYTLHDQTTHAKVRQYFGYKE